MYKFRIDTCPAIEIDETGTLAFLTINLVSASKDKAIELVQIVLEDTNQLNWFADNEYDLKNASLPLTIEKNQSIAERIKQFYDGIDSEEEPDVLDELYTYRCHHGIRFSFRGQDIPEIYIGLNRGSYEISCADGVSPFHYIVDIESLFEQLKTIQMKSEI